MSQPILIAGATVQELNNRVQTVETRVVEIVKETSEAPAQSESSSSSSISLEGLIPLGSITVDMNDGMWNVQAHVFTDKNGGLILSMPHPIEPDSNDRAVGPSIYLALQAICSIEDVSYEEDPETQIAILSTTSETGCYLRTIAGGGPAVLHIPAGVNRIGSFKLLDCKYVGPSCPIPIGWCVLLDASAPYSHPADVYSGTAWDDVATIGSTTIHVWRRKENPSQSQ